MTIINRIMLYGDIDDADRLCKTLRRMYKNFAVTYKRTNEPADVVVCGVGADKRDIKKLIGVKNDYTR